ncbi:MAG TPA: hypothetical protein VFZ53_21575 [Polyangiaceae bacterium]
MIRFLLGLGAALALLVSGFLTLSSPGRLELPAAPSMSGTCLDARIDELRPVTALCTESLASARAR